MRDEPQDIQRRIELRIQNERNRLSIKIGQIITGLQQCINGELDMSGQQVAAANVLLDQTLPNLTAQDLRILSDMDDAPVMAERDALRKQFKDMQAF
jgi:hypothetical protein